MRKLSNTASTINIIKDISTTARDRKIAHLYTQDASYDGRVITVNNNKKINFGSCSYLGLETDPRLIEASVDAVRRYRSQFACSRAYVSCTLYNELEDLLSQMFNAPLLLSPTTSMGHLAVLPIIMEDDDAIILDHQAHYSMQDVVKKLQIRGIHVSMLRHSRLDELQLKIDELGTKYNRVWYVIDGVYSMYGDVAPLGELIKMLNQNKKLHLYVDDAHGISWAGTHGSGYTLSQVDLHPKMIFTTSLGKGFANAGGVFVFPSEELQWKVKNWGGPLTHSGPQPPSVIGACIASAKIHLSEEIYSLQDKLSDRVLFCNHLLKKYDLPLISESVSPVIFIGLGLTKVGYNMVKRLSEEGLYVNIAIFPAVPETCTGIRFTITNHHTFEDIEYLVKKIAFHLPLALKEEGRNLEDVFKAFRSKDSEKQKSSNRHLKKSSKFEIYTYSTIDDIEKEEWNTLLGNNGSFDWGNLQMMEKVFQGNPNAQDNWGFHYFIIRDENNKAIVATLFTSMILKDDMLAPSSVSETIEIKRLLDPLYLTSKSLMMGTSLSDGNHLYLDRTIDDWKEAMMLLLDNVWKVQAAKKAPALYFRDFEAEDLELKDFFMDQGFVKYDMPETNVIANFTYRNREDFIASLPHKKRYHLKKDVLSFEHCYNIQMVSNPSDDELRHFYNLYQNVKLKNLQLNSFKLPFKLFKEICKSPDWEILALYLKGEYDSENDNAVGVGFIYKNENYCPMILGIDYRRAGKYHVYKQILFQTVLRGISSNAKKIYLGFTANLEKTKLDAKSIPLVGYLQTKDSFNMSIIDMIPTLSKHANL